MSQIHPCARITPRTRAEIKTSPAGVVALASLYNITVVTARKWKGREDSEDRSHRPHTLKMTLSAAQEQLVVELRRTVLLPQDDLLAITREFINAAVSRSGLDRCLRRHGVSDLKGLLPQVQGEPAPMKPSNTTSLDSYTLTSSTCLRCLMRRRGATSLWLLIERRDGSICAFTKTRLTSAVPTFCVG
jgi:hypothetical protein